ncbi:redoxin domain-containing protein [bacterium AH-315-E09]|nr:redoxin domain-containing protein [bacterium AH-315-E09]
MPKEFKAGCQRPISNNDVNLELDQKEEKEEKLNEGDEQLMSMIKVGKPAPEFTASAYIKGKFAEVSLSEYKGKWVLLCFYPGDFTFV